MNCVALSLCPVAEESRKHDGCPDDEHAGSDNHHDFTGNAFFPCIHLDVYLQAGIDGSDGCNSIAEVQDREHHRHYKVVHQCQSIRTPAVIHTAAFGGSGQCRQTGGNR